MTDHHAFRMHATGGDSTGKSYEVHINGFEFGFNDNVLAVLKTLCHPEIAMHELAVHAHCHVDGKHINHDTLLDELKGKTVTMTYTHENRSGSLPKEFAVPSAAC